MCVSKYVCVCVGVMSWCSVGDAGVSRLLGNVNANKAAQTEEGGAFIKPKATHIIEYCACVCVWFEQYLVDRYVTNSFEDGFPLRSQRI